MKVAPAPDRRVRSPEGDVLPEAGAEVELDSYWQRRLDDGDVVIVNPPPAPAAELEV